MQDNQLVQSSPSTTPMYVITNNPPPARRHSKWLQQKVPITWGETIATDFVSFEACNMATRTATTAHSVKLFCLSRQQWKQRRRQQAFRQFQIKT